MTAPDPQEVERLAEWLYRVLHGDDEIVDDLSQEPCFSDLRLLARALLAAGAWWVPCKAHGDYLDEQVWVKRADWNKMLAQRKAVMGET